jgi:hypothetical protein
MNDYHSFIQELVFRRTSAMSQQFAPVAEEKEYGTSYSTRCMNGLGAGLPKSSDPTSMVTSLAVRQLYDRLRPAVLFRWGQLW